MKISLTILIPCFNEEETIEICIKKAQKFIADNNIETEILIIDNNSTDKTAEISTRLGARVIKENKQGYGNALKKGIEEAKGAYIIIGDADDSYNFLEIKEFVEKLDKGYDLVIGNRFYNIEKGAMKWSHRYIGTPLLNFIINKKYKLNLHDINCGLRGLRKEKFSTLNLQSEGMEFASEMIIKAKKANLKIIEIPINFYKDKRNKKSNLRTIRDGMRHIKIICADK